MVNAFKGILSDFYKSVFGERGESVIGIDIGSSFLKVVQLKKKRGKAVLETYGELALGPYAGLSVGQATKLPSDKISEALADLFKEAQITTKASAIAIPLDKSLLSVLNMPRLDDRQLAKMIPIEARKYIPVPISEVTLDWWVIPETISGKQTNAGETRAHISVFVVAIHNEVINAYKKVVANMGLAGNILELEIFSTARATFGNTLAPILIFDMGAGTTKIAIMEQGIIRSQHIINRGSQSISIALSKSLGISIERAETLKREVGLTGTGDQKNISDSIALSLEYIFSETNRVMLNYQRKYNKTVKTVILTGGGALLKGLFEKAQQSLETDVTFADPFGKIEYPAFLEPVLKDAGPEFSIAIGLALRKLQNLN